METSHGASQTSTPATQTSTTTKSGAPPALQFEALSETVHVFRPSLTARRTTGSATQNGVLAPVRLRSGAVPRVILIMGWMNAPLRIVTKYASPYALLFPSATIIIKLSQGVSFMRSRKSQLAALEKVSDLVCEAEVSNEARAALRQQVDQLESSALQAGLTMDVDTQNALSRKAGSEADGQQNERKGSIENLSRASSNGGLLLHSFSDGGAYNVSQLLRLLQKRESLPFLAHVMDSSPGKASAYSGSTAMTLALANRPWIRLIARVSVYLYLYLTYAWKALLGQKTWSRVMRERLNTPALWSAAFSNSSASSKPVAHLPPRLYLYSKSDALIDYRAVEEHASSAAKAGGLDAPLQVEDLSSSSNLAQQGKSIVAVKRWEGIPHCDIGRQDFDGYWKAIRIFLETSA